MVTIEQLIEDLKTKDPQQKVEAIVVSTEGVCVVLYVSKMAKAFTKFLKMFN